jgi:hypothetical protein
MALSTRCDTLTALSQSTHGFTLTSLSAHNDPKHISITRSIQGGARVWIPKRLVLGFFVGHGFSGVYVYLIGEDISDSHTGVYGVIVDSHHDEYGEQTALTVESVTGEVYTVLLSDTTGKPVRKR